MNKSVFIALPAYKGQHTSSATVSIAYATGLLVSMGYNPMLTTLSLPDVVLARNLFLSVWFDKTDADYFLSIDDDMEFRPDLVEAMLSLDEPVVGTIYPKKVYPISFVVVGDVSPDNRIEHPSDERFCQVEGMGFGCTLIHRSAIETMLSHGLPFQTKNIEKLGISESVRSVGGLQRLLRPFDPMIAEDGVPISEDLSFCKRWRATGGKLWAATGWEIGHFGPHVWRGQFNQFGIEDGKVSLRR
jgi:hypothetical protein